MRDARIPEIVIPANAGIQRRLTKGAWVPAPAGTTVSREICQTIR